MDLVTAESTPTPGVDVAVRDAAPAARGEPGVVLSVEFLLWCLVLVAAALLRLVDLGALPLAPAESLRARAALELSRGSATPDWGGDLTSGLAALAFRMFDDSAVVARLVPAVLGVFAVVVVAFYRPLLGRAGALAAASLLAISPVAVVSARTLGPEAAALPLTLLLPPLAASVWLDGRIARAPLLAAVVGFGLGSGALFLVAVIVVGAWLAVEAAWCDRGEPGKAARGLWRHHPLALLTALAVLPGLALAVTRYGAGPQRVSLAAVRAWSGPPATARLVETWHYVPDVLLGYEPLALALGVAGAVIVVRRWRGPRSEGLRLALIWAGIGLLVTVLWLHRDPGHLLAVTVPLALLSGIATARAGGRWTDAATWRHAIALLPLVPALGYALVTVVGWANAGGAETSEVLSVATALAGAVVAVAGGLWLLRLSAGALLLAAAWLTLGGLTLHAATNAAFRPGSEILTGLRTLPEVEAVVRQFDELAAPEAPVWVERRLWPALAWPLRDRPVRRFVQTPPGGPAATVQPDDGRRDAEAARSGVVVIERWSPSAWDTAGVLRWWVLRTPWGPVQNIRAVVVER